MPAINVSEADFNAVAGAAYDAYMRGDRKEATVLDRLARKINAALTNRTVTNSSPFGRMTGPTKWQDMPSTLPGD